MQHYLYVVVMCQDRRLVAIEVSISASIFSHRVYDQRWNRMIQKIWDCFARACSLVDEKRSSAVRLDLSGQLFPTSIANFIAYGHNSVVMASDWRLSRWEASCDREKWQSLSCIQQCRSGDVRRCHKKISFDWRQWYLIRIIEYWKLHCLHDIFEF